jgi:hypothetical protein
VDEASRCIEEGVRPRPYFARWPDTRTTPPSPQEDTDAEDPAFRAVRDVHVRLATPAACGVFAVATADFAPLPPGSDMLFEFACEIAEDRLPHEFAEAFESGVRETLCDSGDGRLPAAALRVRLHDARWHEVDSNVGIFTEAGRRAAAEALRCQTDGAVPQAVDPWPARRRTTAAEA